MNTTPTNWNPQPPVHVPEPPPPPPPVNGSADPICSALFSVDEIRSYFEGWESGESKRCSALHNGLLMLDDDQDGIAAQKERDSQQNKKEVTPE